MAKFQSWATLLLIASTMAAHADQLTLDNGNTLQGLTLKQEQERIEFQTELSELWIPRSRIRELSFGDDAENALLRLKFALQRRKLNDDTVAVFQDASRHYAPEILSRTLADCSEDFIDGFARSNERTQRSWLGLMTALDNDQESDPEFLWVMACLFEQADLLVQARKTYLRLPADWLHDPARARQCNRLAGFAGEQAISGSRAGDFIAAQEALALATLAETKPTTGLEIFVALSEGMHASRGGNWRKALDIFDQRVRTRMPRLSEQCSRATLHDAVTALVAEEPDVAAQLNAVELWRDANARWSNAEWLDAPVDEMLALSENWMGHGLLAEAKTCLEACDALTTGATKYHWKMLEFYTMVNMDAGRHPDVLRELAVRMMDDALFDLAREALTRLRGMKDQEEQASALLQELDRKEADWLFRAAKREYAQGGYHHVLDLLAKLRKRASESKWTEPAIQLDKQTRAAMVRQPMEDEQGNDNQESWDELERLYRMRGLYDRMSEINPQQQDNMPLTWRELEKIRENPDRYLELRQERLNDWQRSYRAEQLYNEARRLWRERHFSEASRTGFEIVNKLGNTIYSDLWKQLQDSLHCEWKVNCVLDGEIEPLVLRTYRFADPDLERELRALSDVM